MCKMKTIIPGEFPIQWLLGAVLVWSGACLGAANDPSLIGWWQLNESGGMAAADSSENGNDATLAGRAAFTSGLYGNGVYCDGTEAYVAIPNILPSTCTLAFWFKPDWDGSDSSDYRLFDASAGDKYFFISKGAVHDTMTAAFFGFFFEDTADNDFQNVRITAAGNITAGTWYHVAATWQFGGGAAILYLNGTEISRATGLGAFATLATTPRFGYATGDGGVASTNGAGAVFDDIKLFDRVLTADEIPALMKGAAPELASGPSPWDRAVDVSRDTAMSWEPGVYAAAHDVYLGTSADDVASATRAKPLGVLAEQALDVNTYDPADRFEFGKTYYWRVDEVNATPSDKIYTGEVWSFTVEPHSVTITGVTADADSSYDAELVAQKTVDGSGLDSTDLHSVDDRDMWISALGDFPHWIEYTFDRIYKLDQMWVWNSNQMIESVVGLGAKDVLVQYSTDGASWTDLGDFVFTQASGEVPCSADTRVPFDGAAARYVKLLINSNWGGFLPQCSLSEVRFYAIPMAAREPSPASGATNLHPQVTLSWRTGREAGSHEVYMGTDQAAVADGTVQPATTTQPEYEVPLDLEKAYYWKVVEVNQTQTPATWPSEVWSFSTATYISIDDFESYTNNSPKRVFQTWIDGVGFSPDEFFPQGDSGNGTGSLVGYDPQAGDVMETTYTYAGKQSMPLYYDNSAAPRISETARTLDPATDTTDWTRHGLRALVLWFRGDPANGAAPVYVKINNTKKLYNNGAAVTTMPIWKPFQIDLASVPASDLRNVKSLTIGVGDGSAGGTGLIFVDEIRLYATAPQIATPSDPGTKSLEALYSMEGDVKDSSGKGRHGTANGGPDYVDGPAGYGKALTFDGTNDYVDLPIGNLISTLGGSTFAAQVNFTNTGGSWQRIFDFGTGTTTYMFLTPRQGTNGAMRCALTTGSNTAESGVNGSATLPIGWHHVAVVFDDIAMQIRLYVDGTLVGSGATTLLPKNLGVLTQNWLGRSQWASDGFFNGAIDDFRIYSRPLSEGEVRYLAGDR
ncbi:MAG: discoidin domain-containing protein [Sedimentisphaerales bacterium]|nr:discoidin domain-containing protein [Sedimentisphaerales bacterium]